MNWSIDGQKWLAEGLSESEMDVAAEEQVRGKACERWDRGRERWSRVVVEHFGGQAGRQVVQVRRVDLVTAST
jgi:hypothetical protein